MAAKSKIVSKTATKKVDAKKAVKNTKNASAPKKTVAKSTSKTAAVKKVVKAAVKKVTATKKVAVAKKVAPTKAAAAKKAAPIKKVAVKKATEKTQAASKKVASTKKVVAKKVASDKKVTSSKKIDSIKTTPSKKATTPKTVVAKKEKEIVTPKKSVNDVKVAKIEKTKELPVKKVATPEPKRRSKKDKEEVAPAPLTAREEIADAFVEKQSKKGTKDGKVLAIHLVADKNKKKDDVMEEFKPKRKSILDDPETKSVSKKRYSDEELNEFKELILTRMEKAKKELVYLQGLITRKDDAGTSDTDNKFNHMEDGSGAMEREQIAQLAGRQIQFISHLEKALIRIENKTYGVCRVTGELIDKARLKAVPHATLSIEAKNAQRK